MRYILILLFLFSSKLCFGNTVYYDSTTGKQIVDLSDNKTAGEIMKEFGLSRPPEETKLNKNEAYRIKNKKIEVFDYVVEDDLAEKQKEIEKAQKKESIKLKLGLTDKELNDLKEAVK